MDSINTAEVATKPEVISVIVPVYNVEKYLRKCLDSIVNQTYPHLEIILVNDGSTDSSGEICEEYAARDPRIKLLHKENGGQSSARNLGLDSVTGDYIAFFDSDDWLDIDVYRRCIEKFHSPSCVDAVFFEYDMLYKDGSREYSYTKLKEESSVSTPPFYYLLNRYAWGTDVMASPCNKVYRASTVKDIRYTEGKKYEDVLYTFLAFTRIKSYRLLAPSGTYAGFCYNRTNESSTTHQIKSDVCDLFDLLFDAYNEYSVTRSELLPYIGTLAAKRMDWLMLEKGLSLEVLDVISRYLRPVYALDHLNGGWTNEFKRTMIRLFPRLFVWAFYKKWLPPLSSK